MKQIPAISMKYTPIEAIGINRHDLKSLANLKLSVCLKAQGQAIEISGNAQLADLLWIFASTFNVASEVVVRLKDDRLVMILNHHEQVFLKPEMVNELVWHEMEKIKEKVQFIQKMAMPPRESVIDLIKEWQVVKKDEDIISETVKFIQLIPNFLNPAMHIVIQGTIPVLPALCLVYLIRSYAYNVSYKDEKGNIIPLFLA